MREIDIDGKLTDLPRWAVLERGLIDLIDGAIDPLLEKYVNDDGTIMWPPSDDYEGIDALDDAYESFFNWPLFYLLGGDDRFLKLAREEFDAITEQFTRYDTGHGHPMVVDEYEQGYDWFHQSEGYLLFYLLGMADPNHEQTRERAKRFAGFYLNEHPDVPDIYDENHQLVKSPMVGSMGPAYRNFSDIPRGTYGGHAESRTPWEYEEWKEAYNLPFYDIEGIDSVDDLKDPEKARRMGDALKDRCSRGDVPSNLSITTMIANAYLLTGDEKYREWILEYVDTWVERTEENDWILPDNIGPSGEIGECMNGKWYGGYYGWTWPHGWRLMGAAVTCGAENAMLVSGGNDSFLEMPRAQIRLLIENGIDRNGRLFIPHKHADEGTYDYSKFPNALRDEDGTVLGRDGWFEFTVAGPRDVQFATHLWYLSRSDADRELLRQLRDPADDHERMSAGRKDKGGNEYPWLAYLHGDFEAYPERILEFNYQQVFDRLHFMRHDDQDPSTYTDAYLQHRNPVTTEGLVHLTLGAPQLIYNGGLQLAQVRHFDPARDRPGLPEDVAALVTDIDTDHTSLRLVNLGAVRREIVVQAGAFGEHQFETVSYNSRSDENGEEVTVVDVEENAIRVTLAAGSATTLDMGTKRFVNRPSYAFPWDR